MADFKFNLDSISLIKADFLRQLDLSLYKVDEKPKINVKVSHAETQQGEVRGLDVLLNANVTIINDNGEEQIKVNVEMLGTFTIEGNPPHSTVSYFGNINAPAIIYPFVREVIANLTVKANTTPVLLPAMNFVAAYEESVAKAGDESKLTEAVESTAKQEKPKAKRATKNKLPKAE